MILVTGGAGFIGSNFILDWFRSSDEAVVNVDLLTYAGNLATLKPLKDNPRHSFVRADICDQSTISALLAQHQPRAILNFAAESHVDRSIDGPAAFVQTNIVGTFALLEATRAYWNLLADDLKQSFRFLHVSTDEVYGSLSAAAPRFSETTPYAPNSPYSATKAGSDHLVRAYKHTYDLPVLTTNCSNNYGPYQFPEKLVPLTVANAIGGESLPVYGDGLNIRDWLYVGDHCSAIREVLARGNPGETYNVGGFNEKTNVEVVHTLCDLLDQLKPRPHGSYREQITYVKDRPGHDRRYAVDAGKLQRELGWKPAETFDSGMKKTVQWYLDNQAWSDEVASGEYRKWVETNYVVRERRKAV